MEKSEGLYLIRVALPLGMSFLQSGLHFGGKFIKRRFRPMIGFLRSTCTNCHLEGKIPVVAIYNGHRESMKGRVGVPRSFLYQGGTCTLFPHSFYLLCRNMFEPKFHLVKFHTTL
jgi:hypothetical protein